MAFRSIFKNTFNTVTDKTADALSGYSRAKSRLRAKKFKQLTEDTRMLREIRQSDRKNNSVTVFRRDHKALQDPMSLTRRKMRVDSYKRNVKRKKKKRNKSRNNTSVLRRIFGN